MKFTSEPKKGSTFTFSFKIEKNISSSKQLEISNQFELNSYKLEF